MNASGNEPRLEQTDIAVITLLIVSFAVFFATSMLPGDTATILLGQAATPEAVAGLRKAMHLDDPAILRFLHWLSACCTVISARPTPIICRSRS